MRQATRRSKLKASNTLSDYEIARLKQISENQAYLASLKLSESRSAIKASCSTLTSNIRSKKPPTKRKRKRTATLPSRRSRRAKAMPPVIYTPQTADDDRQKAGIQIDADIKKGYRDINGVWRGEKFGHVDGVKIGTVFGAGDYQRQGRFEMARTGFFKPAVTPEWIDTKTKEVYSVVVNNDNGLSKDSGNVIVYAGAGGRNRGQNRTATQSYDQTWDSATNAALRRNQQSGRAVRVIRGPKCNSNYGTARSGGGYRYDGLFIVEKAELVPTGRRKLLTAFFTLRKI